MSIRKVQTLAGAAVLGLCCAATQAQDNTFKTGLILYDTHSQTSGIQGVGVPPGADAETGDATTLILVYERMINPNFGIELVLGIPPTITAKATGTVAFLGDDVLSAKNVAPTLLVNYHFGAPGDTWRPYVGIGINYTRFVDIQSSLAASVEMSDSIGLTAQAGIDYAISKQWGLFASIAKVQVKSDLVAVGSTVLTTTIDFRPITYSAGLSYKF
jgi:outer membrane protein